VWCIVAAFAKLLWPLVIHLFVGSLIAEGNGHTKTAAFFSVDSGSDQEVGISVSVSELVEVFLLEGTHFVRQHLMPTAVEDPGISLSVCHAGDCMASVC